MTMMLGEESLMPTLLKKTGMLENLKHYSAELYQKLMALNKDLQSQGEIYQWLKNDLQLTERRLRQIVVNTQLASSILRKQCGELQFDLDSIKSFLISGPQLQVVDCQ